MDEASATRLAGELESLGAVVRIVDAASGRLLDRTKNKAGGKGLQSGLRAALEATAGTGGSASLGALDSACRGAAPGQGGDSPLGLRLSTLDGQEATSSSAPAGGRPPQTGRPVPPLQSSLQSQSQPHTSSPSPSPSRSSSQPQPQPPSASRGSFAPPPEEEEAPLELAQPNPPQKRNTPAPMPAVPSSSYAGAYAGAAGNTPAPMMPGALKRHATPGGGMTGQGNGSVAAVAGSLSPIDRALLRIRQAVAGRRGVVLAGVLVAVAIGYLPTHFYAGSAEKTRFAEVARDVAEFQKSELSLQQWQEDLPAYRNQAMARMRSARLHIAFTSVIVWLGTSSVLAFAWIRLVSSPKKH
ncbi:MAG: hypothetical protein V2A73_01950 [Pseudomonadota bacterium]